jgi:hypothetical protein
MATKPKAPKKATRAAASDHVIPPGIPIEALPRLVFEQDERSAQEIADYVEDQSHGEKVLHAENVMTQRILGRQYQCWDVRTNKARFWVITAPTNLYDQKLFPSLDYTLSFHIGLMARVMARREPKTAFCNKSRCPPHGENGSRRGRHWRKPKNLKISSPWGCVAVSVWSQWFAPLLSRT